MLRSIRNALHRKRNCELRHGNIKRFFGQPAAQTHPHLLQEGEVTPGISRAEFCYRRQRLMEAIWKTKLHRKSVANHIALFPSACKSYMTHDIPYPFRQNTDFLYLSGFQEPDSLLMLHSIPGKSSNSFKSVLFVPKRDPDKELWDGPRSGVEGAVDLTGVDEAYNIHELEHYLQCYCRDTDSFAVWYDYIRPCHNDLHNRVLAQFLTQNRHTAMETTNQLVQALRLIKSPAEVALMKRSCEIASEAFQSVMQFSCPGVNESQLYAKVDFECRMRSAEFLAYPPVIAGGDRANIIHYINNNQIIHAGELVLMDAGCELHGYSSDITRTWPVSGQFSAVQRLLYEAVLAVQESCIQQCTTQNSLDDIFFHMLDKLGHQLKTIGLIPQNSNKDSRLRAARQFCPHHLGHYLGMDVHDTAGISRQTKLQPGMVVTVEPGIYIPASTTTVPAEFRGIGIRIEDDVLITDSGQTVLTEKCPKHPDDVEAMVRS
ncbi:xaa-Pro aminopeptidase 3-like isoform X2 [Liolophura sinensis]